MAALEDGWTHETPETDSLLRSYVVGFADLLREMGRALDGRVHADHDVVAVDVGADFFLANGAVLRRPVRDDEAARRPRPAPPLLRRRPRRRLDAGVALADPVARRHGARRAPAVHGADPGR